MRQKTELITELENEIVGRLKCISTLQGEVDAMQLTVSALRKIIGEDSSVVAETNKNEITSYPGYPIEGSIIDKFRYLEDKTLRVWTLSEMETLIHDAESGHRAIDTLKGLKPKLYYHIARHELIKLKYGNKNTYIYYTTRSEWVERLQDGENTTFRLFPKHEPEQSQLAALTEDQRRPQAIVWAGLL